MSLEKASPSSSMKHYGIALTSFLLFGILPIFWSLLGHIDSRVILFHRCFWTFLTLLPLALYTCRFKDVWVSLQKAWPYLALSTIAISINWFTYIYAVNTNHFFEASLAYFISPLITLVLGCVLLKESLTKKQLVAVLLAFAAILYLLIAKGIFPKYALIIGSSFSCYGILGKKIPTHPFVRLIVESFCATLLLLLIFLSPSDLLNEFIHLDLPTQSYLILSGAVTMLPLSLYIVAAKNLRFSTFGILNFIIPTIIFLEGLVYFHEKIDRDKLIALVLIWVAVSVYIMDLVQGKWSVTGSNR